MVSSITWGSFLSISPFSKNGTVDVMREALEEGRPVILSIGLISRVLAGRQLKFENKKNWKSYPVLAAIKRHARSSIMVELYRELVYKQQRSHNKQRDPFSIILPP